MNKILVSDLFGTLIPGEIINENNELEGEKYTKEMISKLDNFLENDNYLYIVSSMDSHDPIYIAFEEIIRNFFKLMDSKKISKVKFYFSKDGGHIKEGLRGIEEAANFNNENGITKLTDKYSNAYAYIIEKKSDIYPLISKYHELSKCQLYSLGDSKGDIDMLCECINLNGKSGFICGDSNIINNRYFEIYQLYINLVDMCFMKEKNILSYYDFLELKLEINKVMENEIYDKDFGSKIKSFLENNYNIDELCIFELFCRTLSEYFTDSKFRNKQEQAYLPKEYKDIFLFRNFSNFENELLNSENNEKILKLDFMNNLIKDIHNPNFK